jgi:hypothetical protein
MKYDAPSETITQLSGVDAADESILAVLAKRSYKLTPGNTLLTRADEQAPLRPAPVFDDGADKTLLVADADVYPFKLLTDVVVRGHVYPEKKTYAHAEVRVGRFVKSLVAIGDRNAKLGHDGRVLFSEPNAFDKVPLTYDRAYGGRDARAEEKNPWPMKELSPYVDPKIVDIAAHSPYLYPRNRHGRGYVFEATHEALDDLRLPNLEDPEDRLTAERLVVPETGAWHTMPLPAGTTWIPPSHFARGVFLGMFPHWLALPPDLREVLRGLLPSEIAKISVFAGHPLVKRLANGASLGLSVPYVTPGERISLKQLHPNAPALAFVVPEVAPRIEVDGRSGKLLVTKPVIHTIEIEPDLNRVSIVWRGSAPAIRPYLPAELEKMPLHVDWRDE